MRTTTASGTTGPGTTPRGIPGEPRDAPQTTPDPRKAP